jgi:hypothetical protein
MRPKRLSAARSVFLQPEQPFISGIENALPKVNPLSFARESLTQPGRESWMIGSDWGDEDT